MLNALPYARSTILTPPPPSPCPISGLIYTLKFTQPPLLTLFAVLVIFVEWDIIYGCLISRFLLLLSLFNGPSQDFPRLGRPQTLASAAADAAYSYVS